MSSRQGRGSSPPSRARRLTSTCAGARPCSTSTSASVGTRRSGTGSPTRPRTTTPARSPMNSSGPSSNRPRRGEWTRSTSSTPTSSPCSPRRCECCGCFPWRSLTPRAMRPTLNPLIPPSPLPTLPRPTTHRTCSTSTTSSRIQRQCSTSCCRCTSPIECILPSCRPQPRSSPAVSRP